MGNNRAGSPSPPRSGVPYCIVFVLLFWWMSAIFVRRASGISALAWDCGLRAVFGAAELYLFVKDFQKGTWTDVIHFRHFKEGLLPGAGLFLVMLFELLVLVTALVSDKVNVDMDIDITAQSLFLSLFLKPLATGFWEEMTFRGLLLEGYFSSESRTWKTRLGYAVLSFAIFGLLHTFEYTDVSLKLFRFLVTGAAGFIFAAMYLYSRNLLCCMLLHFIYNVFARVVSVNSVWYVLTLVVLIAIAFIIAIVYVIKEPLDERMKEE